MKMRLTTEMMTAQRGPQLTAAAVRRAEEGTCCGDEGGLLGGGAQGGRFDGCGKKVVEVVAAVGLKIK